MNFKNTIASVIRETPKTVSNHSPEILTVSGIALIAFGTVKTIIKAKKFATKEKALEEKAEEKLAQISTDYDEHKITDKQYRREVAMVHAGKAVKTATYFAPSVGLITAGTFCITAAVFVQTKRLHKMAELYSAAVTAFDAYRGRVKEAIGEEKENDIFHGIKRDEEGNVIESEVAEAPVNPNTKVFIREFSYDTSPYWHKDGSLNVDQINAAEANLNRILRSRRSGFVSLNEVWRELGLEESAEGCILGWKFKYGDPVYGSTYIDLGYSGDNQKADAARYDHNSKLIIEVFPPNTIYNCRLKHEEVLDAEKQSNRLEPEADFAP